MEATTMKDGLLFELSDKILRVTVATDPEGQVEYLLYTVGSGPTRRFPREEITPGLHNRVHVWIGGDMLPSSSPNDPAFYLNHCNVDRIWAALQAGPSNPPYVPANSAPATLQGHRLDDDMYALLSAPVTPNQMLAVDAYYTYDSLAVS